MIISMKLHETEKTMMGEQFTFLFGIYTNDVDRNNKYSKLVEGKIYNIQFNDADGSVMNVVEKDT